MLEPRRIAARAAAEFMAAQRGEDVGETVGYRIRFESRGLGGDAHRSRHRGHPDAHDPGRSGTRRASARSCSTNSTSAICTAISAPRSRSTCRRPCGRICGSCMMSATLRWRAHRALVRRAADRQRRPQLSGAHRASAARAASDDADRSCGARSSRRWPRTTATCWCSCRASARSTPRAASAVRCATRLARRRDRASTAAARRAVAGRAARRAGARDAGTRRVVLATNVAESSLTLPGVRAVVDTGLAREPRFDPNSGFTRLRDGRRSRRRRPTSAPAAPAASVPARCYRLWPQSRRLDAERTPEIAPGRTVAARARTRGLGFGRDLRWLDAPPAGALAQARELLRRARRAGRDGRITALGRRMLQLGDASAPRRRWCCAPTPQHARSPAISSRCVEARNPLRGASGAATTSARASRALAAWRARDRDARARNRRRHRRARQRSRRPPTRAAAGCARTCGRQRSEIEDRPCRSTSALASGERSAGNLLLHAFPDRIARQDTTQSAPLHARERPRRAPARRQRAVRRAVAGRHRTALRRARQPDLVGRAVRSGSARARFSAALRARARRALESRHARGRCVRGTPLRRDRAGATQRAAAPRRRRAGAARRGARARPRRAAVERSRARAAPARRGVARVGSRAWPAGFFRRGAAGVARSNGSRPYLDGKRRLDALQRGRAFRSARRRGSTMRCARALDAHAPTTIRVPSGMERRIVYAPGEPPVLAVKLQELFGLADTPRIAAAACR